MKLLQRIWDEVRKGENIDLYVAVIAAIIVAILNLFGVTSEGLTGSITLAVLGLLAFSALQNRYQIEKVGEKLSGSPDLTFIRDFPTNFERDLEASRSLILTGVSLNMPLATHYALLEKKAKRGDKIRILLVHPDGAPLEMAVSRALWETDIEVLRFKINSSLKAVQNLKMIAPANVEIRTIKNPLSYSAYLIDNDIPGSRGVLYMENLPYKASQPHMPRHVFRERDNEWYGFYKSEVLMLWENGVDLPTNSTLAPHPMEQTIQTVIADQ